MRSSISLIIALYAIFGLSITLLRICRNVYNSVFHLGHELGGGRE